MKTNFASSKAGEVFYTLLDFGFFLAWRKGIIFVWILEILDWVFFFLPLKVAEAYILLSCVTCPYDIYRTVIDNNVISMY